MKPVRLALLILVACDGGSADLDLEGKPGGDAARLLASRLCEREARCGRAKVVCQGSGDGGISILRCEGRIVEVDAGKCFDELHGSLAELLACKPITGPEATLLKACFQPQINSACLTPADAEQFARTAEPFQSTSVKSVPTACRQLLTQFEGRCQ